MIRIRALNEPENNEEREHQKGPAKEAQEQETLTSYKHALQLIADSEVQKATEILVSILESPYLKNEENKTSCPMQIQIRLGCLKSLSTVYHKISPNPDLALKYLSESIELNPKNVSLWYRLGLTAMKLLDFDLAKYAFYEALKLNSSHWGCIENLITVSYVLNDYVDCLYYCACGLEKDPNFLRGVVFRDYLFETLPHLKEDLNLRIPNSEKLIINTSYDQKWKKKYLQEVQMLLKEQREKYQKLSVQKQESRKTPISFDCSSLNNLLELSHLARTIYASLQAHGSILHPIQLTGLSDANFAQPTKQTDSSEQARLESEDRDLSNDVSQASVGIARRSSSDDKDTAVSNGESGTEMTDKSPEDDEAGQNEKNDTKSKKKSKRGIKWWQLEGKRRSQRVRGYLVMPVQTSSIKEHSFGERLKSIIPESLLILDETENANSKIPAVETPIADVTANKYFGSVAETEDVKTLIKKHADSSIIDLVKNLVHFLASKSYMNWSETIMTEFSKLYQVYRSFIPIPCSLDLNEFTREWLYNDSLLILVMLEISVDKTASQQSPEKLRNINSHQKDLIYLSECKELMEDKKFVARFGWLFAKYCLVQANYEDAASYLNLVCDSLKSLPCCETFLLKIPTKVDNIISFDTVQKKLQFVRNLENMGRVTELYALKKYDDLIHILNFCIKRDEVKQSELMHRFYLADAYFSTKRFTESLQQSFKIIAWCLKFREKNELILLSVIELVEKIYQVCSSDSISMKEKKQTLFTMVNLLIANDQKHFNYSGLWTTPWCIIHAILKRVEHQEPLIYLFEDSAPSSIVLLKFAHEYLSQFNKCLEGNGKFLHYTMDVLVNSNFPEEYADYEETKHCIEQAIFCLYNHPTKKTKHRYLNDHNSAGLKLELDRCEQLFRYYKPAEIPEFDSFDSTSAETEILYQRILESVPEELKPMSAFSHLSEYMNGKIEEPNEALLKNNFPKAFSDIYYLIGDHHFKSKEWLKAIEFYTWDITINVSRFDSWAAIALAKAEMINSSLNSCDNIVIDDITFGANIVVNCFRKALDLQPSNSKLRIEFGSFAYAIHATCSRLLKNKTDQLSPEKSNSLQIQKTFFLCVAIKCFEKGVQKLDAVGNNDALEVESLQEVWIHHYMLGKVTEKLEPDNPTKFLTQYETAGQLLHEQGASYPARLNFNTAPDLSIESLEIYYRIHASIMTFIERYNNYDEQVERTLQKFIDRAAESPFMTAKIVKGEGGESKRKKAKEKDTVVINNLLTEIVTKVVALVEQEGISTISSPCSSPSFSSSSWDAWVPSPMELVKPQVTSYGLSDFCEKMKQDEQAAKLREEQTLKLKDQEEKNKKEEVKKPVEINQSFENSKYCRIITQCVKAFEECLSRFSSHHKSYLRISYTYYKFGKNIQISRHWLLRNPTDKKILPGLFADRRPNNLFNGIWRNPVEDIDRPGSFPYHMSKAISHLLEVLLGCGDHEMLAELAVQLSKIPEPDKQYLSNSDREHFAVKAVNYCVSAAKTFLNETMGTSIVCAALSIFASYVKLQKLPRENALADLLLDVYKLHVGNSGLESSNVNLDQAFRYFQHLTWSTKIQQGPTKGSGRNASSGTCQDRNKLLAIKKIASTARKSITVVKNKASEPELRNGPSPATSNNTGASVSGPPSKIFKSNNETLNSALVKFYEFQKSVEQQISPMASAKPTEKTNISLLPSAKPSQSAKRTVQIQNELPRRISLKSAHAEEESHKINNNSSTMPQPSSSMNMSRDIHSYDQVTSENRHINSNKKKKPVSLKRNQGNNDPAQCSARNSLPLDPPSTIEQLQPKPKPVKRRPTSPAPYPVVKFNTSPFRAQSSVMRSPNEELCNQPERDPLAVTPPKAHLQVHYPNPYFKKDLQFNTDPDIEVIDLTTPRTRALPTTRAVHPETRVRENGNFPIKNGSTYASNWEGLSGSWSPKVGNFMLDGEGPKVLPPQNNLVSSVKVYPLPPKKKRIPIELTDEHQNTNGSNPENKSSLDVEIITLDD